MTRPDPGDREYAQGDHICVAYDTPAEQLAVAVGFIADGLRRDERCLYAAGSERALAEFRDALKQAGIDPASAVANGSLLLLTKAQAHLQGGRFDSERMLVMLNEQVEAALNLGFVGLRTCGDMSWLLDEAPGSEQVLEYEALLNQFFASVRALGMCQYDSRRLPAAVLDHASTTHSSHVIGGRHRDNPRFRAGSASRRLRERR